MLRRAITLLILLLMTQMAVSQDVDGDEGTNGDPIVDSLLREYARANSDTARLRLCYEIANQSNDIEIVTKYSKKGISLFDGNDSIMLARLYGFNGWALCYTEKYDSSIASYTQAIKIYEKMGQYGPMSTCYSNMSICYRGIDDYSNTWRCLYNSYKLAQQSGDTSYICISYDEITNTYLQNEMYVQAKEMAQRMFQLVQQSDDDAEKGNVALLLARTTHEDDTASIKNSIQWARLAESYFMNLDDPNIYHCTKITDTYCSLTWNYTFLYEHTGNKIFMDSAAYYLDVLINFTGNKNIPDADIWIHINSIYVKYHMQDYKGTLSELMVLQKKTQERNYTYYDDIIFEFFYKTYQKLGDYRNATHYLNLYKENSFKRIGVHAAMAAAAFDARTSIEQENEYLLSEKQLAIDELESARKHYRNTATAVVVGIAAILSIIIVIVLMLRHARKTNSILSMHKEEIKAQNEMILNEKEILADKHKRILQSMTYARRIQLATICGDHELRALFPDAMSCYRPRELVSGDWYLASSIGRKKILAVGGSARHGVPGALVCMMTINALKDTMGQLSAMSAVSPSAILRTLKSKLPAVARNVEAGVSLCVFVRGGIKFAAINQNAVLVKDGQPVIMRGNKTEDTHYDAQEGDFVVMYSASTKRELLSMTSKPEKYCVKLSKLSPDEQKKHIDDVFTHHPQSEDVTVVTIKI